MRSFVKRTERIGAMYMVSTSMEASFVQAASDPTSSTWERREPMEKYNDTTVWKVEKLSDDGETKLGVSKNFEKEDACNTESALLDQVDGHLSGVTGIVKVIDCSMKASRQLVYEYLDGGDLRDWCKRRRPDNYSNQREEHLQSVMTLCSRLSTTLLDMHEKSVFHMDMTRANVCLRSKEMLHLRDLDPVVIDFEFAHQVDRSNSSKYTKKDLRKLFQRWTPGYMSPETWAMLHAEGGGCFWFLGPSADQIRTQLLSTWTGFNEKEGNCDSKKLEYTLGKIDVWCFGVTFFELVMCESAADYRKNPDNIKDELVRWMKTKFMGFEGIEKALDLLKGCLDTNLAKRWTMKQVKECAAFEDLTHRWPYHGEKHCAVCN